MKETCPFCKSVINDDASVCASCHAHKSTLFEKRGWIGFLFFGFWYVWLGPGMLLFFVIGTSGSFSARLVWLCISGPITVVGYFLMRALYRKGNRQLWWRSQR